MKKITKFLLPIASTAAVVAPVACLTSCGNMPTCEIPEETQAGGEFTITCNFQEAVTDKENYMFYTSDQGVVTSQGPVWNDQSTIATVACKVIKQGVVDGDSVEFTFIVEYEAESVSAKLQLGAFITYRA